MTTAAETLIGREKPVAPQYETKSWRGDETGLPKFIWKLRQTITGDWLSGTHNWCNTFIRAAIVDRYGLNQDIDSYLSHGPSDRPPEFITVGFQFYSEAPPYKLVGRGLAVKRAIHPYFSGKVSKRTEPDSYFLEPSTYDSHGLWAVKPEIAIREGKMSYLLGALITTDNDMRIHQANLRKELVGDPTGRHPYLYVYVTLHDTYRYLLSEAQKIDTQKKAFESILPHIQKRLQV